MDDIMTFGAYGLLGLMALYVLSLTYNSIRETTLVSRTAESEREFILTRIKTALVVGNFEREKAELSWSGYRKFVVDRKVPECDGVCSFYLRPHDGRALPPFHPGQFLTFNLNVPDQVRPVVRCYSLSDSPDPSYFRVSIKKVPPPRDQPEAPPGLSSSFFHDAIHEGDILDVKAPSGHFHLDTHANTPVVLIGGGIGITPVLSMLNSIVASGQQRETWFFLGVRNASEHPMKEHLERIARENSNVHLHVCYSDPGPESVLGKDYQHHCWVSVDLMRELLPSNNYKYYFCGPPPMMRALAAGLDEWGVPEDDIGYEAFGPATVKKVVEAVGPEQESADGGASSLIVTFARSGKTLQWTASSGTILEFAEANGIAIDSGCRAGNCGTCLTAVKEGQVRYQSEPGDPPEKGSCLTCISVPETALVIEA